MLSVCHRLLLNNGLCLQTGAVWPDITTGEAGDEGLLVGPIFLVQELSVALDNGDRERTPPHYEVWQVTPDLLEALQGSDESRMAALLPNIVDKETRLFRVWFEGNLAVTEERWPMMAALRVIPDRLQDAAEAMKAMFDEGGDEGDAGDEGDDDAPQAPPPQAPAPEPRAPVAVEKQPEAPST